MGQLSPSLFAGGPHPLSVSPQPHMGTGAMARLVVVSNRVPVPGQGQRAGGLAVVLQDVMGSVGLWFGWSGNTTASGGAVQIRQHGGVEYATIDLSEEDYQKFYVGFANSALWPLLHFRLG